MSVVTGDTHQRIELSLLSTVGSIAHAHGHVTYSDIKVATSHMLQHIIYISILHIHSTYIVVGIDVTQVVLQLQVAHVTTIVVVTLWITMTHESHDTLSHSGLHVSLVVQCGSQCFGVALLSHQWGTYNHLAVQTLHVSISEVAITVVHEVLHIAVAHTAILLTRDYLQRLYHHLLVTSQTDSSEPVLWVVVVLWIHILTRTGIVDTDG